VTDVEQYKADLKLFGGAYRDTLNGHYPATTLVEVSALVDDRAMVEMEALAAQP
jgi:enamine deaminase RidA (YjgF/YER057c/UK114 family)